MVTFNDIKNNKDIRTYIEEADKSLIALGFTEHSFAHVTRVSEFAKYILKTLDYPEHDIELVQIAAYLHDIGNLVNRIEHSQSGAVMAFRILSNLDMSAEDIAIITTAIGNHDEGTGVAVNHVAVALIIADKTDVRYTRVRNSDVSTFDMHDRVNYSVKKSTIEINSEKTTLTATLNIDTEYGSVMDYFELFLDRMIMCRKACEKLGLHFNLVINNQQVL